MTQHHHIRYILPLSCLLVSLGACKKFLAIDPIPSQLSASQIFSSDTSATAAIEGLYSQIMESEETIFNGGVTVLAGLSSHELQRTSYSDVESLFRSDSLTSANPDLGKIYGNAYRYIAQANADIYGLTMYGGTSPAVRAQLLGEARFVRAFCYFYLINLFAAVPLDTISDYPQNSQGLPVPASTIYSYIERELTNAEGLLSTSYAIGKAGGIDRSRPNRWTAYALAARVALYRSDWALAESLSDTVIGSGAYTLAVRLDSVWEATSPETIWQMQPVSIQTNTAEGYLFIPSSDSTQPPTYVLDSTLLQSFEAGDQRKVHWIGTKTVAGVPYYYPYKYKVRSGGSPYREYNVVFRLAEQYLIRAEARLQQGNIGGALADLNLIRARAGLPPLLASLDQVQCLAAIQRECWAEFFAEWGHHWLDLKRWGLVTFDPDYPLPAQ